MKRFLCFSIIIITLFTSSVQSSSYLNSLKDWAVDTLSHTKKALIQAKDYWDERGTLGVLSDGGSAVKNLTTFYNPISIYYEEDPMIYDLKMSGFILMAHMPLDAISEGAKVVGIPISWALDPIRVAMNVVGLKKVSSVIEQRESGRLQTCILSLAKTGFKGKENDDIWCDDDQLQQELQALRNTGFVHTGADAYVWGAAQGGYFYNMFGIVGIYTDVKMLNKLNKIAYIIKSTKKKTS